MFKKTSFLVPVFTLVGVFSIIHSDIASTRTLEDSQKQHSVQSLKPKNKHKAYKFKAEKPIVQKAEQTVESGGCQGQCSKSDNLQ